MKTTSPYKTAKELGIEQWERDGLVALVGPLSRGEIKFDMSFAFDMCGSVGCIGGHLATRAGRCHPNLYVDLAYHRPLKRLFFPDDDEHKHPAWRSTPQQAARAIVNFLTLGDPRWDDVMREAA